MQFGLVWMTFKIKFEPNQINAGWIGLVGAVVLDNNFFCFQH
jgi:hypothetical protein